MINSVALFRRSQLLSSRMFSTFSDVAKRRVKNIASPDRIMKTLEPRAFSARPQSAVCYEDLVKDTLKKMIAERDPSLDDQNRRTISDDALEQRFRHYENIFQEAELCIVDLKEATGDEKEEEELCASRAVDRAFEAYLDFLEDLRGADENQLQNYHGSRLENATNLKRLRKELSNIVA